MLNKREIENRLNKIGCSLEYEGSFTDGQQYAIKNNEKEIVGRIYEYIKGSPYGPTTITITKQKKILIPLFVTDKLSSDYIVR